MANPFDQFDSGTLATASNPFDQFDPNKTTATGAFARGAATNVVPSFGAWGGAKAGFMLGEVIGGGPEDPLADALGVLLGIGGAITGSILADKAQNKIIQKADPEAYQTLQKYQQEDLKDHPMASAIGNLAGSIPAFRFGSPVQTAKGISSIYKIATGAATTGIEKKLARNLATQIGVGTGAGIVAPLIQGQKPTAGEITESIAQTLLFGDARFGGKVPSGVTDVRPESEKSNASNQPSTESVPSNPQGQSVDAQAPLRQQGEVAEAPQGEAQIGAARGSGETSPQGNVRVTALRPPELQPALLVDGKPITGGKTHQEILDNHVADKNISASEAAKITEAFNDDANHVFVDQNGKVYDRQQAAQVAGVKVSDLKAGLKSEDLLAAKPAAPAKAATTELKPAEIIALPRQDFFKYMDSKPGGLTREAWRVGQSVKTPEQVQELKASGDALAPEFQKAMAAKDLDTASLLALKRQFFNEAYGAATGTGSAALGLKRENASYEPPVIVDPATGKITFKASPVEEAPKGVGGAAVNSPEFSGGSRDVFGVAERVRQQREAAGKTAPTQPGQGISPVASVERGRQLIASGTDPEKVMADFEKNNAVSADAFMVARAHGEALAKTTNATEEKFGTSSPEFKAAYEKESAWAKRTKAMQTVWARTGAAQQGETDIDTGTFSGIKRAYRQFHEGEELPKADEKKAREIVEENKKLKDENARLVKKLNDAVEKETAPKPSPADKAQADAIKKALDAANKTVRENAVRVADLENKQRVADAKLKRTADDVQKKATKQALDAANKTVRENAIRKANEENARRVQAARLKSQQNKIQLAAAQKALDAANKTVRENAARLAELENKQRIAAATQKQVEGTLPYTRTQLAKFKGGAMDSDQVRALWQYTKKNYIDKGNADFKDIVQKVSTDLGLPFADVAHGLGQPKSLKRITNEVWRKQTDARRVNEAAKRWVRQQNSPALGQAIPRLARLMFGAKVFGHGGVAFGTHAPMVGFMPQYSKAYFRDYGKMFKMVFSPAEYEINVHALRSDPNFDVAARNGLVNDPHKVEDFNNPDMAQYFGRLSGAGNRGYFALKLLRQDMFNQGWNKLPESSKTDAMAQAMATDINHITGVVKSTMGNKASLALFAPRLLMSRAAFLVGDPYKAIEIVSTAMSREKWAALPPEKKWMVLNQVKQKATILAVAYGLLKANQYMLQAMGSSQQVNLTDPTKSDFWKFKVAGMDFSYGNAMLNMLRLPVRLWTIGTGGGTGKLKSVIYPDDSMYRAAGEFVRSQASPLASVGLDLMFKGDYENRPLPPIPGYGKPIPMPKRLQAQGIKPYTWPEFWLEQVSPIPFEEAEQEVWRHGFGTQPEQVKSMLKAAGTVAVMMATGGRLTDDIQPKKTDGFVWRAATTNAPSILNE